MWDSIEKERPIGIPTPRDKIIQKIIQNILQERFETIFKDSSHGYRPDRSSHTALTH